MFCTGGNHDNRRSYFLTTFTFNIRWNCYRGSIEHKKIIERRNKSTLAGMAVAGAEGAVVLLERDGDDDGDGGGDGCYLSLRKGQIFSCQPLGTLKQPTVLRSRTPLSISKKYICLLGRSSPIIRHLGAHDMASCWALGVIVGLVVVCGCSTSGTREYWRSLKFLLITIAFFK